MNRQMRVVEMVSYWLEWLRRVKWHLVDKSGGHLPNTHTLQRTILLLDSEDLGAPKTASQCKSSARTKRSVSLLFFKFFFNNVCFFREFRSVLYWIDSMIHMVFLPVFPFS